MMPLRTAWSWVRRVLLSRISPLRAIASAWFVAGLCITLWTWGLDPVAFPTPDEAVVRFAAALIGKHRPPILELPFPDPEDLFHPRSWVTLGNRAVPTYAPVSFYVYGWLLRLRVLGRVIIAVLPAAGVAAFTGGVGLLLPRPRRWLALLAPGVAFPMVYWLLRPWANVSPLLMGACWCLLFWAKWRETKLADWLVAALLALGFGAAVRPDYAAYLFLVVLLFSLAVDLARWRLILGAVFAAGVLALAANLWLNKVITGHALQAAYQVAVDRQWGPEPTHSIPGLGMLRSLLVPMGIPSWAVFKTAFGKYWLQMGPISLVVVGQLALVPLLLKGSWPSRALKLAGVLIVLFFTVSRLQDAVYGALIPSGEIAHSVPRYLTPVYLIAALPPFLYLGQCKRRLVLFAGATLLAVVAVGGAHRIWTHGPGSLPHIRNYVDDKQWVLDRLARTIPSDATVYTEAEDKWIWSRWRTCVVEGDEATATSISRAVAANLPVFVLQPGNPGQTRRLIAALKRKHLGTVRVDARRGLYRITPP